MDAQWKEAVIDAAGGLSLTGLPFSPGEKVEVLVIAKPPVPATPMSLLNTLVRYQEPTEPVAVEDWEAAN